MNIDKNNNPKGDILIVDDIPENLDILFSLLSQQGYEIRRVISGKQALNAAKYDPPDLILLDILMPDMDGYEVCQQLKANRATCDIPVIFISAKSEVFDKVKAFKLGGIDYITKPFYLEEVLCRIETQLIIKNQKKLLEQEINERKKAQIALELANQELQRLAILDDLTKIANRRRFEEYIEQEWYILKREQLPLSLIMIDVDYFKLYNDNYGHIKGDDCLKMIAQAIAYTLNRPGDLSARYGGEEFAVILPNTKIEGAVKVAEKILLEVHKLKIEHLKSDVSKYVTISMGVASIVPIKELSPKFLINAADKALYEAKKQGRDRIVS